MSLKAKLEAVIYAAEEPVTLTQLAALFATEALEWKAEREAAFAALATEKAADGSESQPMFNAEFDYLEPATEELVAIEESVEVAQEGSGPARGAENAEAMPEAEAVADADLKTAGEATPGEPASEVLEDSEAEGKRLARQKDREVRTILRGLLDELISSYASDDRGVEIKEIAGGYRMATKPECHDAARMFVKSLKPALKLSLPALETLAVIAYKQPVTAPEVNEIRGVDSSGVFGSLLARKLIATAGRKQVIGRPILYKTTKEFLLRFGLKDVAELPSMEEFEKIAQLEFEDMEPVAEGDATAEVNEDLSLEVDTQGDEPPEDAPVENTQETQEGARPEGVKQEGSEQEKDETAAMADSQEVPENQKPDSPTPHAGPPALQAETTPAEAAPAAPSPLEQAETETVPHD